MKKVIISILIFIIIVCLGLITIKIYKYDKDAKEYTKINKYKPSVSNNDNNTKDDELLCINPDYKFWISIDNTNIDYPVVQGTDNEFYLNHIFTKESGISGTLFIDYRNNILKDKNIVIYGHNMRNGSMFNNINEFKNEEFFNNSYIDIINQGNTDRYEIFSVYTISKEFIIKNAFENNEEYIEYLNELSNKSLFKKQLSENTNNIITLVTCSYEYEDARTIVHAKKI